MGLPDEVKLEDRPETGVVDRDRHPAASAGLPCRRRDPRPLDLDAPPHHRRELPRGALVYAAVGSLQLRPTLLSPVPLLGLR
jgi:hypothetical protein